MYIDKFKIEYTIVSGTCSMSTLHRQWIKILFSIFFLRVFSIHSQFPLIILFQIKFPYFVVFFLFFCNSKNIFFYAHLFFSTHFGVKNLHKTNLAREKTEALRKDLFSEIDKAFAEMYVVRCV